jgi:hypothetical protein
MGDIEAEYDFEFEPVTTGGKEGIVFFGHKGSGKTSAALLLEGSIAVLSFDGKSLRAKEMTQPGRKDIEVYDAKKYVSHWKHQLTESANKNFAYVMFLLENIEKRGGVDWVLIDGLEILIEMAEMKMRHDRKLQPFEAFSNLGFWKDRKMNIRAVYDACYRACNKGIVFTTYIDKDEIVNNATLIKKKDVPRWMDIIMYETDAVVKTQIDDVEGQQRFRLYVISSKIKRFDTGAVLDVTGADTLARAKRVGEVPDDQKVNLGNAITRRKIRQRIERCPKCGSEVVNEMSVIHCQKCDWVHEDGDD